MKRPTEEVLGPQPRKQTRVLLEESLEGESGGWGPERDQTLRPHATFTAGLPTPHDELCDSSDDVHLRSRPSSQNRTSSLARTTLYSTLVQGDCVCYGMISEVNCQPLQSARAYDVRHLAKPFHYEGYVHLRFSLQTELCIVSIGNVPLLQVNSKISQAASETQALAVIEWEAYADPEQLFEAFEEPDLETKATASEVCFQNASFGYLSDVDVILQELILTPNSTEKDQDRGNWNVVLDHLPQRNVQPESSSNASMAEVLFRHQSDAFNFMMQRETGQLDDNMHYWSNELDENGVNMYAFSGDRPLLLDANSSRYSHVVTKAKYYNPQDEPRSGILADDMGLGKTLSAIALIVNSTDRAASFVTSPHQSGFCSSRGTRTRSTLVIVPSLILLDQWQKEIELRCKPGAIRFARYHGHDRARHYSQLLEFDIVLTTYGTLATEFRKSYNRGREVLYFLRWFRIVLDEAHTIRSQKTRQFNAVLNLEAQHYWCLTGTPISNGIEDLAALLRICRIPLLQDSECFKDNILKPARRSFVLGCRVLRQTLSPICLRRTRALLNLPRPHLLEYKVRFSEAEKSMCAELEAYSRRMLNTAVSARSRTGTRYTMLQDILQRRIFCNLGTFMQIGEGDTANSMDADEALTLLQQKNSAFCGFCSTTVPLINQTCELNSGALGTCSHVLCTTCLELARDGVIGVDGYICLICEHHVLPDTTVFALPSSDTVNAMNDRHSSKLQRLIEDLLETQHQQKSIVFSVWKRTLDLAAYLCRSSNIAFVKIDGSVSQAERLSALDTFASCHTTSVLLMTLGTGALGLNLASATRIHLLEPQWNPTVEEQAIGRAVRIGQEHNATVIRYTVEDSVEQQVQSLQRLKIRLAAGGLGDHVDQAGIEAKLIKVRMQWLDQPGNLVELTN